MWSMTAVNPQTQVIEIGPAGSRCAAGWTSLISEHDVDQRMASAKLYQFALPFFEAQTERIEVEPLESRRIGRAQHDVIAEFVTPTALMWHPQAC